MHVDADGDGESDRHRIRVPWACPRCRRESRREQVMPSLPTQRAVGLNTRQSLRDGLSELRETVWTHSLSGPIEWGGRHWVCCTCQWVTSVDRLRDAPTRCEVEQNALEFLMAMDRTTRLALKERAELDRLTTRRPV